MDSDGSSTAAPPVKRAKRYDSDTPDTLSEILALEEELSAEELRDIVREATKGISQADKLKQMINEGTDKPSLVWEWHRHVWSIEGNDLPTLTTATLWKAESIQLLTARVQNRRLELTIPENEEDALLLSGKWIESGNVEIMPIEVPKNLAETLSGITEKIDDEDECDYSTQVAIDSVSAICKCLNVPVERCKEGGEVALIRGGVVEVRDYFKGQAHHELSLVQAAKRLHRGGKDSGMVGIIWARTEVDILALSYRVGIVNWQKKKILASGIRQLHFADGEYAVLKKWEEFCGFIKAMNEVTMFETKGQPAIHDSDLSDS